MQGNMKFVIYCFFLFCAGLSVWSQAVPTWAAVCCIRNSRLVQSINVKFVGRRYTTRPGPPTVVSGKHDQKVHSWVVFWTYQCL